MAPVVSDCAPPSVWGEGKVSRGSAPEGSPGGWSPKEGSGIAPVVAETGGTATAGGRGGGLGAIPKPGSGTAPGSEPVTGGAGARMGNRL
jgi:hypothetical protein